MVILDHENLPKTRRAILIVCVLIIAIENYLSISKPEVNFGGAKLSVSKDDLIGGLFIGLFYLWFVAIAQFLEGPFSDFLKKKKEHELKEIDKSFMDPREVAREMDELLNYENNPEFILANKVSHKFYVIINSFKTYNRFIFWLPFIALSLFVVYKYHGFSSAWSTITKIVT